MAVKRTISEFCPKCGKRSGRKDNLEIWMIPCNCEVPGPPAFPHPLPLRSVIWVSGGEQIADLRAKLKLAEDALEPFSRANYVVTGQWRQCLYCGFGTTEEMLRTLTLVDPLVEHNKTCPYRKAAKALAAIRGEK